MRSFPRVRRVNGSLSRRASFEPLESRQLLSATPQLLKDINVIANSSPSSYVELNGLTYFLAEDREHGRELWRSDGTPDGTWLVRDINPGSSPGIGQFAPLVRFGGAIYFAAAGGDLWKSDGTAEGTTLVKDVDVYDSYQAPMVVGDTLYFVSNVAQLWKSDGTTEGTELVKDLDYISPQSFTNIDGTLYFKTQGGGAQLWRTDGTTDGTVLVAAHSSVELASHNGELYLLFADAIPDTYDASSTLAKLDPVSELPIVIKELGVQSYYSYAARYLTSSGEQLFFSYVAPGGGMELWTSDGTESGTVPLADIQPGPGDSAPERLTNVDGTLFFYANDGTHGSELWKSDGTPAGTVLVKDVNPGSASSTVFKGEMLPANGLLYFTPTDETHGAELWRSDGTPEGTWLVNDLFPGPGGKAQYLANINGTIYYSAVSPQAGLEPFRTDGTAEGTVLVKNIETGTFESSTPRAFTGVNGVTLFWASDPVTGEGLWRTDGTTMGTYQIKALSTDKRDMVDVRATMGGVMYFTANDGTTGQELWRSDGTEAGTYLLKDIHPAGDSYPDSFVVIGDTLYFKAYEPTHGSELWKTDGTPGGTVLVADIWSGSSSSAPDLLTRVGDTLFFTAQIGTGPELWKYEPATGIATFVREIRPGTQGGQIDFLTNVNGTLFFVARQETDLELWKSDGTVAGTNVVETVAAGGPRSPRSLTVVNDTLVFVGISPNGDLELWTSDGTAAGTQVLKDIRPGINASSPKWLTSSGEVLYFFANDGTTGPELWKSDGTAAGTVLVKDIRPGSSGSSTSEMDPEFTFLGDLVYFSANDGTLGIELWRSDGTPDGTQLVSDLRPGSNPSRPEELAAIGDTLYFQATDGVVGVEPWVISPNSVIPPLVVGQHLFYNQSKFDGGSAEINAADDAAIAPDKAALKFTGSTTAPLSAITSYSRGINGLMIDVRFTGPLTLEDFTFKMGAHSQVGAWAAAPAPSGFSIRPGAGQGGSDRVVFTWPNNAIQNSWLQVIVEGNDSVGGYNTHTGFSSSEVFFFGNKIGDTFVNSPPAVSATSVADMLQVRNNPGFLQPITNPYDFDKNQTVSLSDELIARNNPGVLLRNLTWDPPAGPLAVEALVAQVASQEDGLASFDDRELLDNLAAAVASALASRRSAPGQLVPELAASVVAMGAPEPTPTKSGTASSSAEPLVARMLPSGDVDSPSTESPADEDALIEDLLSWS